MPPHCPHFGTVPALTEEDAAAAVEVDLLATVVIVVPTELPPTEDVAGLELPLAQVATTAGPVGCSEILSSARTQPVLAVSAAGQVTCWNVIPELSAPWNQSKRQ
jgi:hypothetical protein